MAEMLIVQAEVILLELRWQPEHELQLIGGSENTYCAIKNLGLDVR
ncbi:8799_t:CDS:1, partial [Racocetra persica]